LRQRLLRIHARPPGARLENIKGLKLRGTKQIAMVLYPGFTIFDLVGPHFFLAAMIGAQVRLVTTSDDLSPVQTDAGLAITPTHTLRTCPDNPDVVFVPGGTSGTVAAMQNRQLHDFLQDCGHGARLVTSVCTGALVLASAGLLNGRAATTHWAALQGLSKFGARTTSERVVRDGKFITVLFQATHLWQ
jgi:cyclohexyl-isocyanide hydratase